MSAAKKLDTLSVEDYLAGELVSQTRFYYPDASVICRPNSPSDSFQDEPVIICEVLSAGTRRIDEGEKKDAYLSMPSLKVYVLIDQDSPTVVVYRRGEHGYNREIYEGLDDVMPLPEVEIELPLAEIYETVQFVPEEQ